jgi:hypothetical protein
MAIEITVVSTAAFNCVVVVIFFIEKLRPRLLGNFPQFP